MQPIDLEKVKYEYFTTNKTLKELAEEFNVSFSTLRKRSAGEDWAGQRAAINTKAVVKAVEDFESSAVDEIRQSLERESRVVNKLSELLEKAANEQIEIVTVDEEGNLTTRVDMAALLAATKILKELESVKRSIGGIPTLQEDRMYKLNAEKLEIERKRIDRESNDEDEGGGVLFLPSQIEEGINHE